MSELFPPTRAGALDKLSGFLECGAARYGTDRNFDRGRGQHYNVSMLSPYIRHRILTEQDVLAAALGRNAAGPGDKFVQEVFWRTYWKGWLEMRPSVWQSYRQGLVRAWDDVQTQSGLRAGWSSACQGDTGITCFDHWAQELVDTGYLHNHARMWFASIWIFTLRLPWELGADFFLRHLLDGDPASNTLGWRWVAGLQTQGRNYVASASNIDTFTQGRFNPEGQLAVDPAPLDGPPHPPCTDAPKGDDPDLSKPSVLLLHEDDLNPDHILETGLIPLATATLDATNATSPLTMSANVTRFKTALMADTTFRHAERLGPVTNALSTATQIEDWAKANGAAQIITPYAPVGPAASILDRISAMPVVRPLRDYDRRAWPHATAGFFKFRKKIPDLLAALNL
ncbi:FAD-binding domain-containing protein [Marivita sp. S2033]|uniref:FAD-binding domain-containing protein n=1 Tax=Marivita sp. S2033 TaxID=3373187 RepID=UPI003982203C